MKKYTAYGIDIFEWQNCEQIEFGVSRFYDIMFFFESMKKFNGSNIDLNISGFLSINSDDGDMLWSGNLNIIPEFISTLRSRSVVPNQTYGKLTTLHCLTKRKNKFNVWLCRCSCGEFTEATTQSLISEKKRSCGCLKKGAMLGRKKYNEYVLMEKEGCGFGYTSKNNEFIFDIEDYEKIKDYTWRYQKDRGIITTIPKDEGHTTLSLGRLIMGAKFNQKVDYIDSKFDNRKSNLRIIKEKEVDLINCNNDQRRIKIQKMLDEGLNGSEIARELGISRQRVHKIIK